MPEAAVHKDYESMASEYEIWMSRKIGAMESEPETQTVQQMPDGQFGFRMARTNSRHHSASTLRIDDIHLVHVVRIQAPELSESMKET